MKYLKKTILFISSTFFISLLVATATIWILRFTIGDRTIVKQWFDASDAYVNFVDEVVNANIKQIEESEEASSINTEIIENAAQAAFPPDELKKNVELVIDGIYDWLEQRTPVLSFELDFTENKEILINELADDVFNTAATLPVCETFEIPSEIDVYSAECIPAQLPPEDLRDSFVEEFSKNQDFLADPVIRASDLTINYNGEDMPFYDAYGWIPVWYTRVKAYAWAVLAATIIAGVAIVTLARSHRRGAAHVGKSLVIVAFSTGVFAFLSSKVPLSFNGVGGGDAAAEDFAENIIEPFAQEAVTTFANWNYVFAIIFGVSAVCVFLVLFLTRHHKKEQDLHPQDNDTALPPKPPIDDSPKTEQKDSESPQAKIENMPKHKTISDVEQNK